MKIVVLSDTHMPKRAKALPEALIPDLKSADLILHAGDWQEIEVYTMLAAFSKVEGVHGNVDSPEVKKLFPEKKIIQAGKFRIGLVHGHGSGKTTEKRAVEAFKGENVDCIIFGHSHIPVHIIRDGIVLFNPGSATDKRRQQQFSYGILEAGDELTAKHVYFGR
ncbi:YfcE family phosphodiesterase [Neobacillus piezotolerans]|uniref:Phosphoesterase n=1 Tax=Neobacillus piezotolerans TaxID=2259171 RepID=A0A3D8GQZ4_9BACI|nr:metallophosphoesterase family protein [Neobacillus piezotolerans]RDU36466.1 YfcE family phosphodiesterase [Neobacillus piezotolerans]